MAWTLPLRFVSPHAGNLRPNIALKTLVGEDFNTAAVRPVSFERKAKNPKQELDYDAKNLKFKCIVREQYVELDA